MSEGEQAVDVDALDWEHSYQRSPLENLRLLVEVAPDFVSDSMLEEIAHRSIAGFGPNSTRQALERIRSEDDP